LRGDALRVLIPEETFLRRVTADWIGLSALGYSLVLEPGASPPGWIEVGPLARVFSCFQWNPHPLGACAREGLLDIVSLQLEFRRCVKYTI
jgi:hypothetical protein